MRLVGLWSVWAGYFVGCNAAWCWALEVVMGRSESETNRDAEGTRMGRSGSDCGSSRSATIESHKVQAAFAGDQDAWTELVHVYTHRLYAFAYSRLRRVDLAEEVVQSVFATVAIKVQSGSYTEQGQFEAWLFRIAVNRIRDQIRRAKRSRRVDSPEVLDLAPTATRPEREAPEALRALRESLGQLSSKDREIIELRHHGQMSFKQIAAMLGEPVGTLLARHHRALAKLREMLAPEPQTALPASPSTSTDAQTSPRRTDPASPHSSSRSVQTP